MPSQYEDDRTWEAPNAGVFEDDGEDPAEILRECLEKFKTSDYIMEPGIFTQLKRYFQAGGNPEQVIELLSKNYSAVAQKANLLAEWLILGGVKVTEVQAMVENHLKDLILKGFDPKKADTIFTEEGETPGWLTEMIEHPTWRSLIYRLAEEYPDCLMLNFTIKLISDAGFQGEITSISTAAQQIEVFSRVLKTAIAGFLQSGDDWQTNVQECAKMVCHGAHTYVYSQVIVHILSQEPRGGALMKRLAQEITRCAQQNNHDVTPITLALNGAAAWGAARAALASMLSRGALNPADISALFRVYTQPDPPPVHLLRTPQLLELLVDALFKPGSKLNPEHKHKYMYLLAYAASVCEGPGRPVKDELKATLHAIERVHAICCAAPTSTELIAELPTLYHCIRFPVVSVGVVRWVAGVVTEPSYFKLCTEHCPLPLALLDEVAGCHPLLHHQLLQLLVQLFESPQDELEILVQLELRKMLLARMVNLLSRGCVLPVLRYVKQCWQKGDTDISLIRYFITEVLDAIAPPYTFEFVQLVLPMVENEEITGTMRAEGENDPVSEFIGFFEARPRFSSFSGLSSNDMQSDDVGKINFQLNQIQNVPNASNITPAGQKDTLEIQQKHGHTSNEWQQDRVPNKKRKRLDSPTVSSNKQINTGRYKVPVHNRFDILSDENTETVKENKEYIPKPGPIFVTGIVVITPLRDLLVKVLDKDKFTMTS